MRIINKFKFINLLLFFWWDTFNEKTKGNTALKTLSGDGGVDERSASAHQLSWMGGTLYYYRYLVSWVSPEYIYSLDEKIINLS